MKGTRGFVIGSRNLCWDKYLVKVVLVVPVYLSLPNNESL